MGKLAIFIGPVIAILWLYCVVNVITSRDDEVRHLPKVWWLLIVLFFPLAGSVAWLAAGRPDSGPRRPAPYERAAPEFPEYDRPGRASAADPEADAEFLRKVRERAEEQRRKSREQRGAAEPDDSNG